MPKCYLGVDGGQSSTTALIANETGLIIGEGRAGPCNHVSGKAAEAKFATVIGGCISQACTQAGIDFATVEFAAACFGFSGGAEDKDAYTRNLIRSAKYKTTHDAEIALIGATAGQPGIIVIAGTGSIAFGKNAHGVMARAGGWGYIFGDEGGAFDLARRALRAALQFEEGWGPKTALHDLLLEQTGSRSANELMHRFYTAEYPRARVAQLAPLLDIAALAGDGIAKEVIDEGASKLVWYAQAVFSQLFQPDESIPVAYIGGVFQSRLMRDCFSARVLRTTGCSAAPPLMTPAEGALIEAFKLDGIDRPIKRPASN